MFGDRLLVIKCCTLEPKPNFENQKCVVRALDGVDLRWGSATLHVDAQWRVNIGRQWGNSHRQNVPCSCCSRCGCTRRDAGLRKSSMKIAAVHARRFSHASAARQPALQLTARIGKDRRRLEDALTENRSAKPKQRAWPMRSSSGSKQSSCSWNGVDLFWKQTPKPSRQQCYISARCYLRYTSHIALPGLPRLYNDCFKS